MAERSFRQEVGKLSLRPEKSSEAKVSCCRQSFVAIWRDLSSRLPRLAYFAPDGRFRGRQ